MKQWMKYCLVVILAALMYDGAVGAAHALCALSTPQTARCTLSQAPTARQAAQKFYHWLSANSRCTECADHTQVPADKGVALRMHTYRMQQHAYAPQCDLLPLLSPCPVPDANYYVFGLRRILI